MAGMPRRRDRWRDVLEEACAVMQSASKRLGWTPSGALPDMSRGEKMCFNRRGDYLTASNGLSYGLGQLVSL